MAKISEANFSVHSVKMLKGGIKASWTETTMLGKDVASKDDANKECKDDPHPDFINAFQALKEIVIYDEGLSEDADIKITGLRLYSDSLAQITHVKEIESGATARNSGKISRESEDFELADRLFELIQKINHETYEYFINKKRAQLTMFTGGEDEQEEPQQKSA